MIISSINGRLRYRSPWLKQTTLQQELIEQLQQHTSIKQLSGDTQTGSLLLTYDIDQISRAEFETLISAATAQFQTSSEAAGCPMKLDKNTDKSKNESGLGISANQMIKFGMLGSVIPSMIWASMGQKKIHIASGSIFLVFAAMHVFSYRERLLK